MRTCIGVTLGLVLVYVGVWKLANPRYHLFIVLGTYAVLTGAGVLQLVRATQMDGWTRRLGAAGVVFGFAVTIFLGLRPRTACLDVGPCQSGLTLYPLQFAVGILVVASSLFLDVGGRRRPSASE